MSSRPDDERDDERDAQPDGSDLGFALPEPARVGKRRVLALGLLFLLACLVAFLAAYVPRRIAQAKLVQRTHERMHALPQVSVITPKRVQGSLQITLPGNIQPLAETTIYPRANGYIGRYLVDIGAHVAAGQLLAVIETPELDQELDQARAALGQARAALGQANANRDYAKASLARYAALRPSGVTSQEELEQKRADALVAEANVTASEAAIGVQEANVRRLVQLERFARVDAPFAGVVTTRFIDVGTLVTSGNSTPLFRVVASDPVRVFVQVPQELAPSIAVGATSTITLREYPGKSFEGVIARTAGALDPATRTLNTEVRVPNPKNELLAGMYGNVSLTLSRPHPAFELPATTLYNDAHGLRVACVDANDTIRFARIVMERDLGSSFLVAAGLRGDERVVRIANPGLTEGLRVQASSSD